MVAIGVAQRWNIYFFLSVSIDFLLNTSLKVVALILSDCPRHLLSDCQSRRDMEDPLFTSDEQLPLLQENQNGSMFSENISPRW